MPDAGQRLDSQEGKAADGGDQALADDEADWHAAAHETHVLTSLNKLLADTSAADLPAVHACFEELASYRQAVASAAQRRPAPAELCRLGQRLHGFLDEFDRQIRGRVVDLREAGPAVTAAICRGLGVLPELVEANVFGKEAKKDLKTTVARLGDAFSSGMLNAADTADRDDVENTLAMLTWFSRALKAGLLAGDDQAAQGAFNAALDAMPRWSDALARSRLDCVSVAGCFVQLNTILQFGLLPLDGGGVKSIANQRRLQLALHSLCTALPDIFSCAAAVGGVQIINVGNTLKDYVDAGLLPPSTHDWLMPVVAVLLQRMERVPHQEMTQKGGQVLANWANFLRMLAETGFSLEPAFLPCAAAWQKACTGMVGMLAHPTFILRGKVGQSLDNLFAFIKAMASLEKRRQPNRAQQARQRLLDDAAQGLMRLLEQVDPNSLAPRNISGILLALSHVWEHGMAPAEKCDALAQSLIATIPSSASWRLENATVAHCLRAILQLHGLGQKAQPGMKAAFLRLLAWLGQKPVQDDTQRLYCLMALRLGLSQQWTQSADEVLQAALCRLLSWNRSSAPGMAELEAAIAALRHREETAPRMLETAGQAEGAPLAPGPTETADRMLPGGKLAESASGAVSAQGREKAKGAITYRAPVVLPVQNVPKAKSVTVSTTAATRATRTGGKAASSGVEKNVARKTSLLDDWFLLASGGERGPGLIDRIGALASGININLISRTDEYGNSALYYAVVTGKPELVQWLLRHPAFTLGPSRAQAMDLVNRLEQDILSSLSWDDARQALVLLVEEVRRAWPKEENEKNAPRSTSSTSTHKGKQARGIRKQAPDWETDPGKRKAEWFRLARGNDGGKAARQRMRRLVEIDPLIFSSNDDSGTDALFYATRSGKRQIEAWLWTLYQEAGPQPELFSRLKSELAALKSAAGKITLDQIDGNEKIRHLARLLSLDTTGDHDMPQPAASARQAETLPTVATQIEQAYYSDDAATVRRLLRTAEGAKWALAWTGDYGDSLLALSVFSRDIAIVEALLELNNGEMAEKTGLKGRTALLFAASADRVDILKVLLKRDPGSAARHKTPDGQNALLVAADLGARKSLEYLLAWDGGSLAKAVTNDGENALTLAAAKGDVDVVQSLIDHGDMNIIDHHNKKNANALTVAARHGHMKIVDMLLRARGALAWSSNDDMTPLLLAAQAGHADVVRVFLESPQGMLLAKCVVSARGLNALDLAEQNGHAEAAKVLRDFNGGSLVRKPGQ